MYCLFYFRKLWKVVESCGRKMKLWKVVEGCGRKTGLHFKESMIRCHMSKESSEIICTCGIRTIVQDFPVDIVFKI